MRKCSSGAPPSPPGCPVSAGRKGVCSSQRSMPIPASRSYSTATAELTWWMPWPPALPTATVQHRRLPTDLAAGCARVLVLSPFGGRNRYSLDWGMHLTAQLDELRTRGSRVETIFPDSNVEHLFGANAMDLSLRLRHPAISSEGYGCWAAGELVRPRSCALWGARSETAQATANASGMVRIAGGSYGKRGAA